MNFLDLLFPKRCVGCGKIGKYFCNPCASTIRLIGPNEAICPVCEKPAIDGATHPGCKTHYSLDGLTSFFRYDGVVRKAVKAIKYRRIFDLTKEFINLIPLRAFDFFCHSGPALATLAPYLIRGGIQSSSKTWIPGQARDDKVILVPLPLHWLRLRDRGFNQADVLAKFISRRLAEEAGLHIALRTDILRRVKMTAPQVEMKKRDDRLKNMEHVFAVRAAALKHRPALPAGRPTDAIFLFDDVFTTGATMRAAANILKRAGVKFVWGVTMAR